MKLQTYWILFYSQVFSMYLLEIVLFLTSYTGNVYNSSMSYPKETEQRNLLKHTPVERNSIFCKIHKK